MIANALRQQAHRMEAALGHIPQELHEIIEKIEGHAHATAVVEPEVAVQTPVEAQEQK